MPIIALSADALVEDVQKSLTAGCNLHATKPIKKARLLEIIAQFAGKGAPAGAPSADPEQAARREVSAESITVNVDGELKAGVPYPPRGRERHVGE